MLPNALGDCSQQNKQDCFMEILDLQDWCIFAIKYPNACLKTYITGWRPSVYIYNHFLSKKPTS